MRVINKNTIEKEKLISNISNESNIVWLRWFFILILLPLYMTLFKRQINIGSVIVLAICILYNFLNYIILVRKRYSSKWFNNNIYIDIILITCLIISDGGYDSSIYIAYFIFIMYESVKKDIVHPFLLCIVICLSYIFIGYYFSSTLVDINVLFFRVIFIILLGFFSMDMVNQFRIHDKIHKKEYNLARKDKLTGLYNRTELEDEFSKAIDICLRENSSLCALMFDLDNFKSFNDCYGHIVGDDLLRYFSKIIQETISSSNKGFRYGGEEFLVLLKDTDLKEAIKIAEIIRKKLASSSIHTKNNEGEKRRITVSCGVACCPDHSISYFELLELADKALYKAKSEGKNRVEIAEKENLEG